MLISCNLFVPYKPPLLGLTFYCATLKKIIMKDHPRRCANCAKSTAIHKSLKMYHFPKPSPNAYR